MSPWAVKRLHEYGGDISKFKIVKLWPSILDQVAIAKTLSNELCREGDLHIYVQIVKDKELFIA